MAFLYAFPRDASAAMGRAARIVRPLFRQINRVFAWRGANRNTPHSECGSSLVEFALTFSVLMAFVFTLMEACMASYTYSMISESAREATRYAIVHGSTCLTSSSASCTASAANINSYAKARGLPNVGGGTLNVNTTFPDGNAAPGSRVKVDITYLFPIKLPFVPKTSLSLDSSSQMVILQ
jgi:Flp pilus assembly protein TadG